MEPHLIPYIYNEELFNLEEPVVKMGVLVAVDKSYHSQKNLLNKILGSIGYTQKNVKIIESNDELDVKGLKFNTLINFGVNLKGLNAAPYSELQEKGRLIIYSDALSNIAIDDSNEGKKKLWSLLKKHFK